MVNIDQYYHKIIIEDERDTINFYAQEIGFFKSLLEKEKDDTLRQWFNYFMVYSETELELANERLEKFRAELIDYEQQQRELLTV